MTSNRLVRTAGMLGLLLGSLQMLAGCGGGGGGAAAATEPPPAVPPLSAQCGTNSVARLDSEALAVQRMQEHLHNVENSLSLQRKTPSHDVTEALA